MKVLFLTRKYPPQKGGMETYSYNLTTSYEGSKKIVALGKKQIHLLWFYPYCLIYVLATIRKWDVIEIGDMLLCGIGWIAKKIRPSLKVVVTVHGLDITFSNKLYQWYLKHFSYGLDMYVPNSNSTKLLAEERGYSPIKVVFPATLGEDIFEGVEKDREKFCKKYDIDTEKIILCTTGRLVKRKGVAWFLENVMSDINTSNLCYLIVGEGEHRAEIENAIKKSGAAENIKMVGRISDMELQELYLNADIFVMPNIIVENNVEGYGMVAVEAAAGGCIVLAAACQGIADAVKDGVTGILAKTEDAEDFKNKLEDIIQNLEEYKKKTAIAQEYVYQHCTGKAIAKEYEEIFRTL